MKLNEGSESEMIFHDIEISLISMPTYVQLLSNENTFDIVWQMKINFL